MCQRQAKNGTKLFWVKYEKFASAGKHMEINICKGKTLFFCYDSNQNLTEKSDIFMIAITVYLVPAPLMYDNRRA